MKHYLPVILHSVAILLSVAFIAFVYLRALGSAFSTVSIPERGMGFIFLMPVVTVAFAGLAFAFRAHANLLGVVSLIVSSVFVVTFQVRAAQARSEYLQKREAVQSKAEKAFESLPHEFVNSKGWMGVKSSLLFLDQETGMYMRADLSDALSDLSCVAKLKDGVLYFPKQDEDYTLDVIREVYGEYLSQDGKPFTDVYSLEFVPEEEFRGWHCPWKKYEGIGQ